MKETSLNFFQDSDKKTPKPITFEWFASIAASFPLAHIFKGQQELYFPVKC